MNLKTIAGRRRLQPYREPHWQKIPTEVLKGTSLGFRRSPETGAETWHVRVYVDGQYHKANLGRVRPDFEYKHAFRAALDWAHTVKDAGPVSLQEFTLEEVIDDYLMHLQGNSSRRFMDKRRQAAKRLDALLPERLLKKKADSITSRNVTGIQRDYQQRKNLNGDPISGDSVNRVMTHLIAAMNHGHRNDMITTNDAWKHYQRLPEATVKRRGKEYIPLTDREAFIQACPEALRAFVSAMQYLGARPSELRRLRVSDVTKEGVNLTTYKGKGGVRMIPLQAGFPAHELFDIQCAGKQPDDFVFTTETGKQWSQANLAKHHNKVRDEGGFSDAFETYVWRHCRITDWSRVPFPAPEVARLAGTSLEHIQKNYYSADSKIQSAMVGL